MFIAFFHWRRPLCCLQGGSRHSFVNLTFCRSSPRWWRRRGEHAAKQTHGTEKTPLLLSVGHQEAVKQ